MMEIRLHWPTWTRHDVSTMYKVFLYVPLLSLCVSQSFSAIVLDQCRSELGMGSKAISDEDITASSSYNAQSVGPQNARLGLELQGGAWCPKKQISADVYEYLEISLNGLHIITGAATQGRFGNGHGKEYADEYMLEYWRPGMDRWLRFKNRLGQQVLEGNADPYSIVERNIDPPIIATKIRFIPYSVHLRTVCMRVEVYGCPWQDGLLSYSMPQGEHRGAEMNLSDMTYDGIKEDNYLHGGLGQLTDGHTGEDTLQQDAAMMGKGYEWVGWKNETVTKPMEIVFEFETVRNFSAAYFFCHNMHTKNIQVFSSAKIWFSIGGKYFHSPPVNFSYMPDVFFEKPRNVTINLYHRVGRFVKVQLMFAAKWMLVSEVSFNSVPAVGNFSDGDPPPPPPIVSTAMNDDSLTDEYVGMVIGLLAAVILLLVVVIMIIMIRNRRRKLTTPHTILKPADNRVTINLKDLGISYSSCSPLQNGSIYGHQIILDDSDPDKLLYQVPQDYKNATYSNESTISREYAIPDVTMTSNTSTFHHHHQNSPASKPIFPQTLPKSVQKASSERFYAATDVVKLPNLQGVSGNTVYATPSLDLLSRDCNPVREVSRQRLYFMEKLGEGQFGEVHVCQAEGIPELVDVPCHGNKILVAVKTLRKNATEQAKKDFYKEVKVLSSLSDPNIVHVLGVCTKEEPMCMVVEYLEKGDLNQFLRQHLPENTTISPFKSCNMQYLSHGSLIFIALQIASGMKYLESLNFVHRDLATRNCLVGRSLTIKISDFGMSRELYSSDYYKTESKAMIPIRWMAWESVLLGKFTTKSDVWAFAVTLWEILTFARQQPFSELPDTKVLDNVSHLYHNNGQQSYLFQPPNCPKEIFDLMKECWQRSEQDRPNFRDIHLFLQRKNLGYAPHM